MVELKIVKHRIKIVAFGWSGTLMNDLSGMQETLVGLVGPLRGQLDLADMARYWHAELRRLFEGRYQDWSTLAMEALLTTCRQYGVPEPEVSQWDIQHWIQRWPLFADQDWVGHLGRRFRVAVMSEIDRTALANCLLNASRPFDFQITSDLARAYPPAVSFFKLLRVQLRLENPDELLVISARPEIDLIPARAEGYQTAQVVRSPDDPEDSNLEAIIKLLE